jgi:5-methylcytosine-specific restriction enzyme A
MNVATGSISNQRNPPWSRDELILALHLYMHHREALPSSSSPEVGKLSGLLNRIAQITNAARSDKFRNRNGVHMKLMNFMRLDPHYLGAGKSGLPRGNKDEAVVWQRFAANVPRLDAVAEAIRLSVGLADGSAAPSIDRPPGMAEAEEGAVLTRGHLRRERNKNLVHRKKEQALKVNGTLACEGCGFDFAAKYGERGAGVIDCHHVKPLHTLAGPARTRLEDLVLLCANCHRIVHSEKRWLTLEQLKEIVQPA